MGQSKQVLFTQGQAGLGLQHPQRTQTQQGPLDTASQGSPALRQRLGLGSKGSSSPKGWQNEHPEPFSDPETSAHAVPLYTPWANCYSL